MQNNPAVRNAIQFNGYIFQNLITQCVLAVKLKLKTLKDMHADIRCYELISSIILHLIKHFEQKEIYDIPVIQYDF